MTCAELLETLEAEECHSCSTLTEFLRDFERTTTPVPYQWVALNLQPDYCGAALLFCEDGILEIPWDELQAHEGYEQLVLEDARIHVDPQSEEFTAMMSAIEGEIERLQSLNWDILQLCARLGRAREEVPNGA